MVTFDSRAPGTGASAWEDSPRWDAVPSLDWSRYGGLLVVAAHPDDETLGAGGVIDAFARRGLPTRVVVVTGGSPLRDRDIMELRRAEFHAAVAELAPSADTEAWDYTDAATGSEREAIRARLDALVSAVPNDWLIIGPWPHDRHHDHDVVGELVAETSSGHDVIFYPIWMWHWAAPAADDVPWSRMLAVPVDQHATRRALSHYRSQTGGPEPLLTAGMLDHFTRDRQILIADAIPEAYFTTTYRASEDPWGFTDRWYEQRKRAVTLASLPHEHYARGLEIGCSIGVLTDQLADRVDDLLATDISAEAVEHARRRLGERARVEQRDARTDFPDGEFDLIVLSEVGYYLTEHPLRRMLEAARDALAEDGILVSCHWRHPVADYPLDGDDVTDAVRALDLPRLVHYRDDDFLLEVFGRDPRSVAMRTGLA